MKKYTLLCVLAVLCAVPAFAQGGRYDSWVVDSLNRLVANPTIRVCPYTGPYNAATAYVTGNTVTFAGGYYTAAANSTNSPPSTNPTLWTLGTCSTTGVLLYADKDLTFSQPNPFVGDSHGNYGFFAATGTYVVQANGYAYYVTIGSNVSIYTIDAFNQAGADMCAKLGNAWASAVANGWTAATVDARGFHGAQACASQMYANYPYTKGQGCTFNGKLLLGDVEIRSDVQQILPCGSTTEGTYNVQAGSGTSIRASNAFYTQGVMPPALVQFGTDTWTGASGSVPPEGVQINHVLIQGKPPSGGFTPVTCLLNQFSQEGSGAGFVMFDGCLIGLQRENGGTLNGSINDGPYHDLKFNFNGINDAAAQCIASGLTTASLGPTRGFRDLSCNLSGDAVQPTNGITIDSESTPVEHAHIEGFVNGIVVGANHIARNFRVTDLNVVSFSANLMANAVWVSNANANTGLVQNIKGGGSISTLKLLKDDISGITIDGSTGAAVIAQYAIPSPSTSINALSSATASDTVQMNNFGLTLQGGTAQSATPVLIKGNASNVTAGTLFQTQALGTNEKPFQSISLSSLLTHAINGQEQLTPVAVATSGGSVSSPGFLVQGNCWNGTTGAADNYASGVAYAGGTNPTGTFSWTRTGGCGGAITFDVSNFSRLKAAAVLSSTASAAAAGQVRLASADTINFRNNAGTNDISLGHNTSDQLTYNGSITPQNASATPTVNRAVCWKTVSTLGFCSTQPDSTGACTCN